MPSCGVCKGISGAETPGVTVTDVVPDIDVFAEDVALTVSEAAVSSIATVSKPLIESINVPNEPPETDQVTACDGLPVPITAA